jgi:hypothetical protein
LAAVGSITFTEARSRSIQSVSMLWTSDAAGAVSGINSPQVSGELLKVVFTPGSGGVQPTALYDVTMLDTDGFDVLAGKGANLSNAAASQVVPLVGDGVTTNQRTALDGVLQLVVAAAGNAKQGTVTIYFR